jgi:ATP-dependent 26S proteasome regulatory subunit
MKNCKICKNPLELDKFKILKNKKKENYISNFCLNCFREKDNNYKKEKYQRNREKIIERNKKYYENNKEECKQRKHKYYIENRNEILTESKIKTPEEREATNKYLIEYRKKNKESLKEKRKVYIQNRKDPKFKIRRNISNAIYQALKYNNSSKNNISCLKYLNYTITELKEHIESLFEPWMNWNNRGIYDPLTWDDNNSSTWKWQLDHIIPQSKLPYASMEDENFKKCWALENLRPISAKENNIKGDKL